MPFKKGKVVGYINEWYNYNISVNGILILGISKFGGTITWFDNNYYSRLASLVQNAICELVGLPKRRNKFGVPYIPKEKWYAVNVYNLPDIKKQKKWLKKK